MYYTNKFILGVCGSFVAAYNIFDYWRTSFTKKWNEKGVLRGMFVLFFWLECSDARGEASLTFFIDVYVSYSCFDSTSKEKKE